MVGRHILEDMNPIFLPNAVFLLHRDSLSSATSSS